MTRADAWAGSQPLANYTDDIDRGYDVARLIADKSTSITVQRAGSALSAQTVRIEEDRGDRTVQTEAGQTRQVDAIVLGYKGHASISDTDLQPGDRFKTGGLAYEVIAIVPGLADSLQVYCRVRS